MGLTLLIGGARSGKSRLAIRLADEHDGSVVFIATGEAGDEEMADRIARHRAERPAGWLTVEEPVRLRDALAAAQADACVVVDCLSLWVANLIEQRPAEQIEAEATAAAKLAASRPGTTIAVTNEVGLGVVPATPPRLSRRARPGQCGLGRSRERVVPRRRRPGTPPPGCGFRRWLSSPT